MAGSNSVSSARPLSGQNRWNRPRQNYKVYPKVPAFNVVNVQLDLA
jgi:hypothetical protein